MFCANCGNELEEGTNICPKCGASVNSESVPQPEWQEPQPETPVDKVKKVVSQNKKVIGIAAAAIVVVVLLIVLFGGSGYKSAVKDFMKAFEKADGKEIVNLTIPKKMQEDYFDEMDYDKEDYIDNMEESLEELWEELEDEDGTYSWEIKKAESLKKLDDLEDEVEEWGIGDIDDYRDRMDSMYDDYGFDADKIKDVYAVEIKTTVKMDGDRDTNTTLIFVYKYSGSWYVDMTGLNYMFY